MTDAESGRVSEDCPTTDPRQPPPCHGQAAATTMKSTSRAGSPQPPTDQMVRSKRPRTRKRARVHSLTDSLVFWNGSHLSCCLLQKRAFAQDRTIAGFQFVRNRL